MASSSLNKSTDDLEEKNLKIYQFKISLLDMKPKIWRRIQVPGKYNFRDLHLAIQNAMGWKNNHLHQFEIKNPRTGEVDYIKETDAFDSHYDFCKIIAEDKAKISEYFLSPKDKIVYEYDLGESWRHEIVLEKILPAIAGTTYPKCVAGKRACPKEDCGGYDEEGDSDLLDSDSNSEDFDPKKVKFNNDPDLNIENK